MMIKLLSNRMFFLSVCLIFRIVVDFSYVLFVYPLYEYSGFPLSFSFYSYSLSWLVYLFCLMLSPHLLNKVSDYFITSFLLTIIAPLSSLVGLSNLDQFSLFITAFVFLFFRLFQHGSLLSKLMPVPGVMKVSEGRAFLLIFSTVSVCILIFWYFYSGAFQFFNLNIFKVYDFRSQSAQLANVGFFSYFNNWVFGVFSVFLMSYCLYRKSYIGFLILFLIQLFFYGVSNHKSVLLYPVMILVIWFYFRYTRAISVVPLGFSVIFIGCLLSYLAFDHLIAGSLFIRRVFFVPAKLTLDYFSFFSANELVWWSNSVLSRFIEYPYDLTISKVIGEYNGSGFSANNGFISAGYAHANLIGVAIYTFIFSYFLKVLDSLVIKSDVPIWLALCMTIVPLRAALISSDLLTTMLTHGLAISLLMVMLFRRSSNLNKTCCYKND
ncbi:hypothetical protein [Vreelandella maris]|uniref:Oligosaccharide repeat unit polymerase n=1 Tax=Vreelandella maris TaxID=2729617 RepID=A0A7Y6RB15_9GAMM|nr:hypothetical protein [Halomonas maris]NVF13660.1 hypothetical protein [Halomonas maris]